MTLIIIEVANLCYSEMDGFIAYYFACQYERCLSMHVNTFTCISIALCDLSQRLQTCRVRLLLHNSRIYPDISLLYAGISSDLWSDVQRDISKLTRVCIYDRAGLGFSDRPVFSTLTGRLCVPHHCHFIFISAYVCIMGELHICLSHT